jgi:hypothetical protein
MKLAFQHLGVCPDIFLNPIQFLSIANFMIMEIPLPQVPKMMTGMNRQEYLPTTPIRQGFERPDNMTQRRGGACPRPNVCTIDKG